MSNITELGQKVEIGKPVFMKLFALSDKELKEKLKSFGNKVINELIEGKPIVTRTIVSEEPYSIKFDFYDSFELNWIGISYKPEHGPSNYVLIFAEKKGNKFLEFINED